MSVDYTKKHIPLWIGEDLSRLQQPRYTWLIRTDLGELFEEKFGLLIQRLYIQMGGYTSVENNVDCADAYNVYQRAFVAAWETKSDEQEEFRRTLDIPNLSRLAQIQLSKINEKYSTVEESTFKIQYEPLKRNLVEYIYWLQTQVSASPI